MSILDMWCWSVGEWRLSSIIVSIIISTILYYYIKRRPMVQLLNKIPGPKGIPILGCALQVTVNNVDLFRLVHDDFCSYGPISRVWLAQDPLVILSGANTVESVLSSTRHIEKSSDYVYLHPWLGTGLLTASGKKWHSRRKLLTPAFHFKILEDSLDVFDRQAEKLVTKLSKVADGTPIDILPYIALCTLDIICESAMGYSMNTQDQEESKYVKAVKRINYLMQRRMTVVWQHPDIIYRALGYAKEVDNCLNILHQFTDHTIKERRKMYEDSKQNENSNQTNQVNGVEKIGKRKKLAFLDLLLEASEGGKGLSDENIREEVDTFMFEGHDTTAAGISWSMYCLARNKDAQAKVHAELDSIFGGSDRPATKTDLSEMKYLENCIKETLRLLPSVPYIGRELKEEICIEGYRIPAGVTLMVSTYKLHRDPVQFPDPERFDPDRFLPENSGTRHPFSYVPFSAGPRNCIGQKFALLEEKAVLSRILRRFYLESDTAPCDLQLVGELILRSEHGNYIKMLPRTSRNKE